MEIISKTNINAPAENLWKILAGDYNKVCEWTSLVEQSVPNPDLPTGKGRACKISGSDGSEGSEGKLPGACF